MDVSEPSVACSPDSCSPLRTAAFLRNSVLKDVSAGTAGNSSISESSISWKQGSKLHITSILSMDHTRCESPTSIFPIQSARCCNAPVVALRRQTLISRPHTNQGPTPTTAFSILLWQGIHRITESKQDISEKKDPTTSFLKRRHEEIDDKTIKRTAFTAVKPVKLPRILEQ